MENATGTRTEVSFASVEPLCWWEMVSYTGSRKGGWREPGRCERSDVGISHRLAKNKDAGIKVCGGVRSTIPMG